MVYLLLPLMLPAILAISADISGARVAPHQHVKRALIKGRVAHLGMS